MCIKLALNASRIANLIVYRANDYGDTTPSDTRGRPLFKRKSFNSFFGNRLILFILYWSDDNCNVFYSRGEILVRDSNRSDWIYIVKSVSTQTQSNQWAQHNQLQISNTTTDMALCIAIHNWFISWFKSLNRPTSIILYAKHGIIPLSLQKLDLYW